VEILKPGDLLLLYTDGITEAMAPDGELFGVARLDPILSRCHASAEPPLQEILAAVDQFTTGLPATDDRTLLAIQVT
jgi:sigma-B regulation protein RsbU (phosphoserine phosphatase)